jgi:hypothetical protein
VDQVFCLPIAWIATAIERSNKKKAATAGDHEPLLSGDNNNGESLQMDVLHAFIMPQPRSSQC